MKIDVETEGIHFGGKMKKKHVIWMTRYAESARYSQVYSKKQSVLLHQVIRI